MEFLTSNAVVRSIIGAVMLLAFYQICSMDKIGLALVSLCLSLGISYEIIIVTQKPNTPLLINAGLVSALYFSIYLSKVLPTIAFVFPKSRLVRKLGILKPFIFCLYSIGFIITVISLKIDRISEQMLLLVVVHIMAFMAGHTCALSIQNMATTKFFYAYPSFLVITNDIFAYFIGKRFGRTSLISVSPNKTVEGFIGGLVFTLIVGIVLSYLKIKGKFLSDSADYNLSKPVSSRKWFLGFPRIYLHCIAFVMAASFIAPFSGFIASAIKRTFEKKDFGCIIPGHGGITDRFDCQVFMVFFTHYYLKMIGEITEPTVVSAYNTLVENFHETEIGELSRKLSGTVY